VAGDLEAAYQAAISKAAIDGKGSPSARSMSALAAWCVTRGAATIYAAQGLYDWIASYSATTIGSVSYTAPGTYPFTVPSYNTLNATLSAAGGGGGGTVSAGIDGGNSSFAGTAVPGGGGGGIATYPAAPTNGTSFSGGAPGGAGGSKTYSDKGGSYTATSGRGGNGAYATLSYLFGALTPGTTVYIVVGAGGPAGSGAFDTAPVAGTNGSVSISWS
jgi:hypothetical protein